MLRPHFVFLGVILVACSDAVSGSSDASTERNFDGSLPPSAEVILRLSSPEIEVEVGQELQSVCVALSLGNDQPLYVDRIDATMGPGWHHSNWVFVPEDAYTAEGGGDTPWRCAERGFNEVAGAARGGVFFAQATAARQTTQSFANGAVVVIPPRSKVIGNVHLVNLEREAIRTSIDFEIHSRRAEDVETILSAVAIDVRRIEIPARSETFVESTCDFERVFGRIVGRSLADDPWRIYYVMPHYHALGRRLIFETVDAEGRATTQVELDEAGVSFDSPLLVEGSSRIRVRCEYENLGRDPVAWGFEAADEMCTLLAYTDLSVNLAGLGGGVPALVTRGDLQGTDVPCTGVIVSGD